jgi:hypothetical protein
MGKRKWKVYWVGRGRATGIFESWDECWEAVNGFPNNIFKGFNTRAEAEQQQIKFEGTQPHEHGTAAPSQPSLIQSAAAGDRGECRTDDTNRGGGGVRDDDQGRLSPPVSFVSPLSLSPLHASSSTGSSSSSRQQSSSKRSSDEPTEQEKRQRICKHREAFLARIQPPSKPPDQPRSQQQPQSQRK